MNKGRKRTNELQNVIKMRGTTLDVGYMNYNACQIPSYIFIGIIEASDAWKNEFSWSNDKKSKFLYWNSLNALLLNLDRDFIFFQIAFQVRE